MSTSSLSNALPIVEYWKSDFHYETPRTEVVPYLWKYEDMVPILENARDNITAMDAERRLICFSNPGLKEDYAITKTLLADLQLLRPGERAPAHRHSTSSIRLCLEGKGGYTMVELEKCPMERGDVIVNPIWAWHHHGNEGKQDVIWMDVLDVPMVTSLGSIVYDYDYSKEADKEDKFISAAYGTNRSEDLFSAGGVLPKLPNGGVRQPQVLYRYARMRETLERMKHYDADPFDGYMAEYVNTETGRSIIPTMAASMQLITPGQKLRARRRTASAVYCVLEGRGVTEIAGKNFEWTKNDVFVVPSWAWHKHSNVGAQDAVLFSVTDALPIQTLGMYREEALNDDGSVVSVKRDYETLAWRINEYEPLAK